MSLCGTTVNYNGVIFVDPVTTTWDTEAEFDSFGHVDPIGLRVRMSFETFIHVAAANCRGYQAFVPYENGMNVGPALNTIIQSLLTPRRRFIYQIGDQSVYDVMPWAVEPGACSPLPQVGDNWRDVDLANGPKTKLRILAVQGTHAVKVRFEIEFLKNIRCTGALKNFLSCRWVVDEDFDFDHGCIRTRTYRGKFRVKGIYPNEILGINPHDLARDIAVPPKQIGFQRKSITFHPSNDQLEMDFTIRDVEKKSQPPAPCRNWEGTFSLSMPPGEVTTESALRFTLWADPEIPRPQLFNCAYRIIEKKLNYSSRAVVNNDGANPRGDVFVLSAEFSESLGDNQVSADVRVKNIAGKDNTYLMNMRMNGNPGSKNMLGVELPNTTNAGSGYEGILHNPLIEFRGPDTYHDLTGVYLCALATACCPQEMPLGEDGPKGKESPEYIYTSTTEETLEAQTQYDKYSETHQKAMYQWYKLSNEFHYDSGWRCTPRGVQCYPNGGQATVAASRIHCGIERQIVRIHAARVNAWPELPKYEHWTDRNGILHVLEGVSPVEICPPAFSADALSYLQEVFATYRYTLIRPPNRESYSAESMPCGILPYTTKTVMTKARSALRAIDLVDPKQILDPETSN